MPRKIDPLTLLACDDPESVREGAQRAGEAKLSEAIPLLVKHIASPNIGVQEAADRALRKIGGSVVVNAVIPLLRSADAPVRNIAMDLLRVLGAGDFEALRVLLTDDDPDIRIFAADILGAMGTSLSVPPLCKALLQDPEVNVRYQAAVSLGILAYPEAAGALNKALEDEEWVQFAVIESLTKIKAESSVQAMTKALGHSTDLVASMIVDALGEMGNMKAIPLLLKRLDSSPAPLCNKIVRAIIRIMGDESLHLLGAAGCRRLRAYMSSALTDEDTDIQDAVLRGFAVLGGLGTGAAANIFRLLAGLHAEKDADRAQIMLAALIKTAEPAELEQAARTGEDQVAQVALAALIYLDEQRAVSVILDIFWERSRDMQRYMILELANHAGLEHQDFFLDVLKRHDDGTALRGALLFLGRNGESRKVQERIIDLLTHPYDDVKEAALEALIHLHTPELEEFFRELAHNSDPAQRMMAIYALSSFDRKKFVEELKNALGDPSPEVRRVAVESFGRGGDLSDEGVGFLEERMGDENREVRLAVVNTLGTLGDARALPCLFRGLDDPAPWVRARCIERLGELRVQEAREKLVEMLGNESHLVVIKSVEALGKLGGETAFRAILPFLEHPDADLQEAAEQALNSIRQQAGE
ncbi:MAG: HEAT repeat domain-containing protein [Deltaproteobacteria bacterium]|nr:HEAT repeat domain-containing protein [Deltaproteobacteria bacterium]